MDAENHVNVLCHNNQVATIGKIRIIGSVYFSVRDHEGAFFFFFAV